MKFFSPIKKWGPIFYTVIKNNKIIFALLSIVKLINSSRQPIVLIKPRKEDEIAYK